MDRGNTARVLWLLYAAFIVYATTLPFEFEVGVGEALETLREVPPNPFTTPGGGRPSITDMVQNVVLFVPFGLLGALTITRSKGGRESFLEVILLTLFGAGLSAIVELLQLFTYYRITSANDVMTNTTGTFLGAAAAVSLAPAVRRVPRVSDWLDERTRAAFYVAFVAAILLCVAAWHPFDASLRLERIASKARGLLADPWQAGAIADEGLDLLRYAFFSAATAVWLRELGMPRARTAGALLGAFAACGLELSQILIGGRMPGLKDALMGSAGATIGAATAPWMLALPPAALASAVAVLAWTATAMAMLAPFTLAEGYRPVQWTPFLNYWDSSAGRTVSHIVELVLAFFPVGFALRWVIAARAAPVLVLAAAAALGGLLEYLQGWIIGRYPDVTDALVLTIGAAVGAWAAGPLRRGRARAG